MDEQEYNRCLLTDYYNVLKDKDTKSVCDYGLSLALNYASELNYVKTKAYFYTCIYHCAISLLMYKQEMKPSLSPEEMDYISETIHKINGLVKEI